MRSVDQRKHLLPLPPPTRITIMNILRTEWRYKLTNHVESMGHGRNSPYCRSLMRCTKLTCGCALAHEVPGVAHARSKNGLGPCSTLMHALAHDLSELFLT